jgi:hypothetical protein
MSHRHPSWRIVVRQPISYKEISLTGAEIIWPSPKITKA